MTPSELSYRGFQGPVHPTKPHLRGGEHIPVRAPRSGAGRVESSGGDLGEGGVVVHGGGHAGDAGGGGRRGVELPGVGVGANAGGDGGRPPPAVMASSPSCDPWRSCCRWRWGPGGASGWLSTSVGGGRGKGEASFIPNEEEPAHLLGNNSAGPSDPGARMSTAADGRSHASQRTTR